MKEIVGDLWDIYDRDVAASFSMAIVIPTNGTIRNDGANVMGAGLAKDVKQRWPKFPSLFGDRLKAGGNVPYIFPSYRIVTFPVKHNWWENADLKLIRRSAMWLGTGEATSRYEKLYIPHVGCGNGHLEWFHVRKVLAEFLGGEKFIIVRKGHRRKEGAR